MEWDITDFCATKQLREVRQRMETNAVAIFSNLYALFLIYYQKGENKCPNITIGEHTTYHTFDPACMCMKDGLSGKAAINDHTKFRNSLYSANKATNEGHIAFTMVLNNAFIIIDESLLTVHFSSVSKSLSRQECNPKQSKVHSRLLPRP
uniref:Uncharacterized protein n=1 Tax=Glossina brevipalpis TaxID=37001 RepID=A0A1A9W0A0_9MUSC